ncbi:DUF4197 domain-containing protein [Geobacter sp. FeAm09]|uniref:DUF4197 domain-containing protein n=1 Tax=Geobacter sp. FeAm09 TaxID=2597769 RepID=UPI0011F08685|nr:DUF4197 domain-containing protein [Geobacter sp. FeAm09]QEM68799.1 DUF4197 domain-containing protein [Geobacter sp. FeAm09]
MKRCQAVALFLVVSLVTLSTSLHAGFFDEVTKGLGLSDTSHSSLDDSTIIRGLKEALATGTTKAVKLVSQRDGYFGNDMIKILMPEKIRTAADLLGKFGFQPEVDAFVLSMNRAAEKAAPKAAEHFVAALKEMSFDDARKILHGGNTSATEYFRQKTGDRIYSAFKPVVASSMQDVGVSRNYTLMMHKFESIPFAGTTVNSFDLDGYVTSKAVDGLFRMLGEEEKKIRTDPAARGTELLRKVFGK